mgnify:CR=1 FL=1
MIYYKYGLTTKRSVVKSIKNFAKKFGGTSYNRGVVMFTFTTFFSIVNNKFIIDMMFRINGNDINDNIE